jgi:hypothetical protein
MMGHHERPRRQRHELPRQQKRECVVGQDHEVHAGKECREKRQNPVRRRFMAPVAEAVEARRGAPEIDHDQEEGGERVDAEMCAEPWQAERYGRRRRLDDLEQAAQTAGQ